MDGFQVLHRVGVSFLVVGEAAERVRRADERLVLGLVEGVLGALLAQLRQLALARGDDGRQLLFRPFGVARGQARHADADVGVLQAGVGGERGAELLLGGARAALLEQPPAVGQHLLGVGFLGRRDGRRFIGGEMALLVLLARAARARIIPARRAEPAARLGGRRVALGGLLSRLGRLGLVVVVVGMIVVVRMIVIVVVRMIVVVIVRGGCRLLLRLRGCVCCLGHVGMILAGDGTLP